MAKVLPATFSTLSHDVPAAVFASQLDAVLVVFPPTLKTEVVKCTAWLHVLGMQTVLTRDIQMIHKDGETGTNTNVRQHAALQ